MGAITEADSAVGLTRMDGPAGATEWLLLAHGAGAGMDHEFMRQIAEGLAERGIAVIRFEFPYMHKRREDGKKRPPDRMPKLLAAFEQQLSAARQQLPPGSKIFIGGKSMGGRVASLLAADLSQKSAAESAQKLSINGVICLGFPFHPPGKPERYRGEHLAQIQAPFLLLQGERDTFGNRIEINNYQLPKHFQIGYLGDGDHSFKPRKASGLTLQQNIDSAIAQIEKFIKKN